MGSLYYETYFYKWGVMERKKFNRGTVTGGIMRIIIAAVAMFIAILVLSTTIKSWDAEDVTGGIFMCIIAGVMLIAGLGFFVNGVKMIIDGKKSLEVSKKGHPENGKILDLFETEITENNNGSVSRYSVYNLKFEYTSDGGNLCESQEQISQKFYEKLQEKTLVPIIVYGERAIFDRKKFSNEIDDELKN